MADRSNFGRKLRDRPPWSAEDRRAYLESLPEEWRSPEADRLVAADPGHRSPRWSPRYVGFFLGGLLLSLGIVLLIEHWPL